MRVMIVKVNSVKVRITREKNEPYVDCEGDDCEGEHCGGEKMNLMWILKVNIVKVRITK